MATQPPQHGPSRSLSSVRDGELMLRVQAGSKEALAEVMDRYWEPLVRHAWTLLGGRDAAEDAAQETLVRFWQQRASWTATSSLRGFLYRVLRNYVLNQKRAERVRRSWREQVRLSEDPLPPTPLELFESSELARVVKAAIDALPARRREVFLLSRYAGLSYEEIGEAMGISQQTVANQMSAALRDIRAALAPNPAASKSGA